MKTIKRIVFTGGPCSGKTTFTSRVQQIFAERGYRVIIDHESATDLITGGISPATLTMYEFQKYCIDLQLKKEELCYKAAQELEGDRVLIFIDRGIIDDMAYVGEEDFRAILSGFGLNPEELNDRYDFVVHLTTAAKGKEEAYTLANNAARYETIDEAKEMDDLALMAWRNHPNRVIIGNEDEFEIKMAKAIQAVFEFLGEESVEKFRRYLVKVNDDVLNQFTKEANYSTSHIIQHYLESYDNNERRIRSREMTDGILYTYSEANYLSTNERVKTDRALTEREYKEYLKQVDPTLNVIDKTRYSFIDNELFYKLDVFDFDKEKGILCVDQPSDGRTVELPSYIEVLKDVTDDVNYKNYYLAKSQKY